MKKGHCKLILLTAILVLSPQFLLIASAKEIKKTIPPDEESYLTTGSFIIRTNSDYRYVTIKDPAPVAGSIVFSWEYTTNAAQQQWRFIAKGGGFYKIRSVSGLFLTQKRVLVPSMDPEINEDSQLWTITPDADGFYTIKSKTNKFLVISDARRRNGALMSFANSVTGTDQQKWHLIKWTMDGRIMTTFNPPTMGFQFANTFEGVDASYRYGGLCGGMVYTSMDYFRAHKAIPTQTYTPANRTPLQSYIFGRQNDAAIGNQLDKWTELRMNPFGWRDAEFYEWGLRGSGGGRVEELRQLIDATNPAPLGMYEGGTTNFAGQKSGDHQVLAVGYSMGRYTGDLGAHKQEMKIFVYDPNYPGEMMTLVADISRKCFFYVESGNVWRTYFVDRKYSPKTAPDISALAANEPEGSIRHIYVTFKTGGDDLRGGNDNVNLKVNYRDGSSQTFMNVNGGARWVDNYEETVPLILNRSIRSTDITSFMLVATFGGGIGGDNWNLDNFWVTNGGGIRIVCANCEAHPNFPLFRFTGDQKILTIPVR